MKRNDKPVHYIFLFSSVLPTPHETYHGQPDSIYDLYHCRRSGTKL